jgi:hypothetical protein
MTSMLALNKYLPKDSPPVITAQMGFVIPKREHGAQMRVGREWLCRQLYMRTSPEQGIEGRRGRGRKGGG